MKELLLRSFLPGKKLDIVNQQRVDGPVKALEFTDCIELQRSNHGCYKGFRMQIDHLGTGFLCHQIVTNCMH